MIYYRLRELEIFDCVCEFIIFEIHFSMYIYIYTHKICIHICFDYIFARANWKQHIFMRSAPPYSTKLSIHIII
jgi:hypothetical protein